MKALATLASLSLLLGPTVLGVAGVPLFGARITAGGGGTADPLVPADGTQNITGILTVSGAINSSAGVYRGSGTQLQITDSGGSQIGNFTTTNGGTLLLDAAVYTTPLAKTIADNGNGGTAATDTALPTGSLQVVTCSDAQGCEWTITETSAPDGFCFNAINVGANNLVMKHAAGQVVFPGAADQTLGTNDSARLCYSSTASAWLGEAAVNR